MSEKDFAIARKNWFSEVDSSPVLISLPSRSSIFPTPELIIPALIPALDFWEASLDEWKSNFLVKLKSLMSGLKIKMNKRFELNYLFDK